MAITHENEQDTHRVKTANRQDAKELRPASYSDATRTSAL